MVNISPKLYKNQKKWNKSSTTALEIKISKIKLIKTLYL